MVPDQRDVQTTASKKYGAYVSHTIWPNFEASERLISNITNTYKSYNI